MKIAAPQIARDTRFMRRRRKYMYTYKEQEIQIQDLGNRPVQHTGRGSLLEHFLLTLALSHSSITCALIYNICI